MTDVQALTLTDFLLARIAEDEAAARESILPAYGQTGEWVTIDDKEHLADTVVFARNGADRLGQACDTAMSWIGRPARDHIARWDPARVLAECEAKRRIVELHKAWPVLVETPPELTQADDLTGVTFRLTKQIAWTTQDEYRKRFGSEPPTAPMLAALALPYADHPDYRGEWRP